MQNLFGMFIHWGIYAQTEDQEQVLNVRDMAHADYERLASTFNPVAYDPDDWAARAVRAGMKYICFTTKHHDGFCMWDTKETDYNIMHTPYGRDVLAMLADACSTALFVLGRDAGAVFLERRPGCQALFIEQRP